MNSDITRSVDDVTERAGDDVTERVPGGGGGGDDLDERNRMLPS